MIISFIYYVTHSKFVDSSFPQCNVHTDVQDGWLAFTPLDGYLKLWEWGGGGDGGKLFDLIMSIT